VTLARVDVPFDAELGMPAGTSERLLHDALSGDRSLFTRKDAVEATWWVFRSLVDTGTGALPARCRGDRRAPPTSFEALHLGPCPWLPVVGNWQGSGCGRPSTRAEHPMRLRTVTCTNDQGRRDDGNR
jgi:hypothetical protein